MDRLTDEMRVLMDSQKRDAEDRLKRANRRAGLMAGFLLLALVGLVVLGVALVSLVDSRRVDAFVVSVNGETGGYDVLTRMEDTDLTGEQALALSELYRYVVRREGFDRPNVREDYDYVALTSSPGVFREYAARFDKSSDDNIYRRLGSDRLKVTVHSLVPIAGQRNMYQIRYSTTRKSSKSGITEKPLHYVAYAQYEFSKEPRSIRDRWVQPFGFTVVNWRSDLENFVEKGSSQ